MKFNLDDYSPVEERIALFYEDCPEGRIHTSVERLEPPLVVFRAEVYRDGADDRPWATGFAYEKEGEGHVNRTSYIENCETSAIGRALANAGYHGKRDGSPRPSREEMAKVQRMGGEGGEDGASFSLDDKVGFGKHKALTWREAIESERDYVLWALDNVDRITTDAKLAIRDAMQGEDEPDEMEVTGLVLSVQGDLDTAAALGIITPEDSAKIEKTVEERDVDHLRIAKDWLAGKIKKAPYNQPEQADEAKAKATA